MRDKIMIKGQKYIIPFLILPIMLFAEPVKKWLVSVEPPLNTTYSDFAPSFTADGKTMVFNSIRSGKSQDIYMSYLKGNKWTEPRNLRVLNSPYHDETPFITPDGKFIFFASDRPGSLEMPKDNQGRILISYDLYLSENVNGRWRPPERVPGNVNTVNHERAPSICLRTEILYYTSWPFGKVKNARIMRAELVKGDFINVQELPHPINTSNQDMALVPNTDCSGFYFSSRRPGGFGGWDIFYVSFTNGVFGKPINLGAEINSPQNEFFYTKIGSSVFICSNRPGGQGKYDIFSLKPEKRIQFLIRNKKSGKPLSTNAELSYEKKSPPFDKPGKATIEKKSDNNGMFSVNAHPLLDRFDIAISKEDFLPLLKIINPLEIGDEVQVLDLVPIEKDASFDIHAIHFDYNSAKILPQSYHYLDLLAAYMKKNDKLSFRIIGHTDLRGSAKYNKKLSLDRARSVKRFLVKRGLNPDRFEIEGAGKSRPKVPKLGPGFDEQNRRTEFKLIGKD
jgi:outer membrane protein OmpA-like peptidoglycan-associated protein